MCKNYREKGACRYGDKCLFAHGEHELTRREVAPTITQVVVVPELPTTIIEQPI